MFARSATAFAASKLRRTIGTIATCATQPARFEAMTNLEIALSILSVVETTITIILHRRMKKRLDEERKKLEDKQTEYETLIRALPIGRALL